ncbi:MAG: hypothetical protein R3251_00055 [Candidatus Spechtbacterales bacterium]|nr:hypothetical protein [Candidatus Spechtbacterales bacterium]
MSSENQAMSFLREQFERKEKRVSLTFEQYLEAVQQEPGLLLRNVFQLYYDMVDEYVEAEESEYSEDPEFIGFVKYDCSKLFIDGADNPFFADTPFANRFVRQAKSLRQGYQQNRIYVYDGPSGAGKSTFLNNLLRSFEAYTKTARGTVYETVWKIDEGVILENDDDAGTFIVPCPSHDYPILIIPKSYRGEFLKRLLHGSSEIKDKIFGDKEYSWVLRSEACTICRSIFDALLRKLGSVEDVLAMVSARPYRFDRSRGEGISIFNPGDKSFVARGKEGAKRGIYFTNEGIQKRLDRLFGPEAVRYIYSPQAKTNNGIYALMDVKEHNRERLTELHNIISEGVHRVGDIEERIHSLFFALMNEEDKSVFEDMESLRGRVQENHISYVLEPETEANIYRNVFGKTIDRRFLPRILENFARVIISSRMNTKCEPQEEWISDMSKYKLYCDKDGLLLRMKLYRGDIPSWLSQEDRKNFTAPIRKAIIAEGQNEGNDGIDGRRSIALFSDFYNRYQDKDNLINMENLVEFFEKEAGKDIKSQIPDKFLSSLVDSYDYMVLNEVKEALYFYNKAQIERDLLNFLCATSYDLGDTIRCSHTGEDIEVTGSFFKLMAKRILGKDLGVKAALEYAKGIQQKYITIIASRDKDIRDTDLYEELFNACMRHLKDEVLEPFSESKSFREAVKAYDTAAFDKFDIRIKDHVNHMIENLREVFDYSQQGAQEIALYVLDKNLAEKYSSE